MIGICRKRVGVGVGIWLPPIRMVVMDLTGLRRLGV